MVRQHGLAVRIGVEHKVAENIRAMTGGDNTVMVWLQVAELEHASVTCQVRVTE